MKKMLLVVIVVALASFASAQSTNVMGRPGVKNDTPAVVVHHILKNMTNNNGSTFTAAAGLNAVDAATTVVCPGTSGTCLLQAQQSAEVGGNVSGGRVAFCFYVDGVSINACFFDGEMLADANYTMFSVTEGTSVAHGSHTVQTAIYTDGGGIGGFYNFNYSVYKP
jgi:hypothetical protein